MKEYFLKSSGQTQGQGQGTTPAGLLIWLNELVGSETTQGTIVRVIDWQIVPMGSQFMAIARVEVKV